jgi:serine/threonine-protein kinase
LKVLDFGIAKSFTGLELSGTTPGLGTPLWTAPEQAHDDYVPAPSADVWALGLLSFFILTGRMYWKHAQKNDMLELAIEILKSPIAAANARGAELGVSELLPPGYESWFARAVNRDAAARWQDVASAREAWPSIFEPEDELSEPTGRSRPLRSPGLLIAALIAGCTLMGYTIYLLIQNAKH